MKLISSVPSTREKLAANRTYYVATTGSDSNTGLTVGSPFLTIQKAVDTVAGLDLNSYQITIQIADGTYSEAVNLKNVTGQAAAGDLVIQGNSTTPANVLVSVTSNNCFTANGIYSIWDIRDLKVQAATSGFGILVQSGTLLRFQGIDFGACASSHFKAEGGIIVTTGNYSISGGGQIHGWVTNSGGQWAAISITVTILANVTFTSAFLNAGGNSYAVHVFGTFTLGAFTVTGTRYLVSLGSVVNVAGAGANYFPGTVAGSANAAQYATYA